MLTVCETCLSKRSRARHADQIPSFRASVIKRIFNTRVVLCLLNESLKTNVSLSPGGPPERSKARLSLSGWPACWGGIFGWSRLVLHHIQTNVSLLTHEPGRSEP